ncbi:MAG TPA: ATP-binding protein [Solirubrobacterales bacterium]|nr:ATP-binding protein [Solirubrobacterales bacterium]
MTRFPLRYARRNVLIGPGGEAAALYRADTVAYPFLPTSQKWALLHRLERLAHLAGADFAIWRVQRSFGAERYPDELAELLDPEHGDPEAWRRYLQGHEARLGDLGSHLPEVYLAVSLTEGEGGPGALRSFGRVRRRVEELAGVGRPSPISGAELEALAAVEQRTFERLAGAIALRRASTRELQWLLRRAACRGVAEPALDRHWEPDALVVVAPDGSAAYEPLERDLWSCANAPATEEPGKPPSLVVEAEEGTSCQAFLCAASLAEEAEFPGAAELLFGPAEGAGFPVDAVLYAQWIGNREALGQVRKRILDVEHAYREQLEGASGPGVLAEEDRELAREYEAILQSSAHPPMLRASLSLAVGAPDRAELERRVTTLRERFGEVALHRPRGLQHALFCDHLPQPGGGQVPDYAQQMTVEQFGAMVATASSEVGSPDGIYVGHTPQGRPVRLDPTEAPRTARPSGVLLAGTLGSGKTLAAQTIAYAAQRRGSLVVDFDPKPDHGLDRVPELEGEVEVLELSGDSEHRGKLDPLQIGLPELREELAASYLIELLRDPPPAWENAIDRAVRDAVRAGERSLMYVVERLRGGDVDAAREAGDALEVLSDFGLARLGFAADGMGEAGEDAPSAPVITIRTPGLSLPDPGASRETYTRAERVSVATLSLVAAKALRLVSTNRQRHKIVLLDEAWFFLSSAQGRALLNRVIRLGRAFNATVLVATQRLADLGELSELFGVYLLFGQETEAEARAGLAQVGLDSEGALAPRLTEYRQGLCLMRDLDGRVGEVQFDLVFPELLAALDSTPKAAAE